MPAARGAEPVDGPPKRPYNDRMLRRRASPPPRAPPAPGAPAATEPPAMELPYEIVPFSEPMVLDAGGCDYGGAVRSVEGLDEITPVFSLCGPGPALLSQIPLS